MKKTTKTSAKPPNLKPQAKSKARKTAAPKTTPRRTKKNAPTTDIDNLGELPRSYGHEQIFVIAQEPCLLFCYWDYTLTDGLDGQVFLRHSQHDSTTHNGEVPVPSEANSWYLPVREADASYRVELGFYDNDGWKTLTKSDTVLTPQDKLAEPGEALFTDVNFHLVFQQMVERLRDEMRDGDTLAAVIARLRQHSETSSEKLSPAQLSMLQALLSTQLQSLGSSDLSRILSSPGASLFSGGFAAALSSWGAGGASWGAAPGELSSGFLARFGLASESLNSGAWSSALGSWSSGAVTSWGAASSWGPGASWSAQPFSSASERSFFMHVNAEVIFYGGTQPDAKVTIDGREVGLRPDGSFHFHCVFPDGAYEIPIVATSPDGQEARRAVLRFERATAREGEVGATVQPPIDRPMGAGA